MLNWFSFFFCVLLMATDMHGLRPFLMRMGFNKPMFPDLNRIFGAIQYQYTKQIRTLMESRNVQNMAKGVGGVTIIATPKGQTFLMENGQFYECFGSFVGTDCRGLLQPLNVYTRENFCITPHFKTVGSRVCISHSNKDITAISSTNGQTVCKDGYNQETLQMSIEDFLRKCGHMPGDFTYKYYPNQNDPRHVKHNNMCINSDADHCVFKLSDSENSFGQMGSFSKNQPTSSSNMMPSSSNYYPPSKGQYHHFPPWVAGGEPFSSSSIGMQKQSPPWAGDKPFFTSDNIQPSPPSDSGHPFSSLAGFHPSPATVGGELFPSSASMQLSPSWSEWRPEDKSTKAQIQYSLPRDNNYPGPYSGNLYHNEPSFSSASSGDERLTPSNGYQFSVPWNDLDMTLKEP